MLQKLAVHLHPFSLHVCINHARLLPILDYIEHTEDVHILRYENIST